METELVDTSNFKAVKMPNDWRFSTVGQSLLIRNNLRFPISEEEREKIQGDYPYYGPTKVQGYVDHYRVEGKYALIGEDGDHFLKFKELQMTLLVEGKFNVNNHAHIIEGTDQCTTEWFYYFFAHRDLFSHLTRQGVGRYKLTKDALQRLPIQLPPLSQQRKITAILSTWDEAIQTAIQLLKAKQERKHGLMQQLLTGQKRLPGFSGEWREVKLGEVFSERNETKRSQLPLLAITASNGVVMRNTLEKRDTSNEDKGKYLRICPGDIGYNTMRMWQGVSGVSQYEGLISPAYTVLIPAKSVNVNYMAYLFKYQPMIHLFWRYSQGLVDDTLNCKYDSFRRIHVTIPNIEEQHAITEVLSAADEEIRLAKAELEAMKEQKRGLMQELLTGKTLVTVEEVHQSDLLKSIPV